MKRFPLADASAALPGAPGVFSRREAAT